MKKTRYWVIDSFILTGAILILTGLYYCVIKAGIPYQDPTLEMQIQYAVDMGIGKVLVRNGFVIAMGGTVIQFIVRLLRKKCHNSEAA